MHTSQKRFQCESHRDKRAVLRNEKRQLAQQAIKWIVSKVRVGLVYAYTCIYVLCIIYSCICIVDFSSKVICRVAAVSVPDGLLARKGMAVLVRCSSGEKRQGERQSPVVIASGGGSDGEDCDWSTGRSSRI